MSWQPIRTAPIGVNVMVGCVENDYCREDTVAVARLSGDGWIVAGGDGGGLRFKPTHWRPAPEPPS